MKRGLIGTIKYKYKDYKWRKQNLPSAEEVIYAIFDLFTKEEIESMLYRTVEKTVEDFGVKKGFLKLAPKLRTYYSLEESVAYANLLIRMIRNDPNKDFYSMRYEIARDLFKNLFFCI